ncbi:MAG: pyridoxamine 5'-phosphate oxidase family protein [Synergistaceae bacterium]|nr:pyridoxamine 5'-phosphate oxidase family protein [Synergistota bacterium]NLM72240.1 pyridoxamine 5'-phosphate oxidase family protein [Synergistaceae bacterium]
MNRPMRRVDREITDQSEIDDILGRAVYGHLAVCYGGEPYVVPMNFVSVGESLYFHCAAEGHKTEALRQNPRACFQAEIDVELIPAPVACGWGLTYRSVVVSGLVSFVEDVAEKAEALTALMKKLAGESFSHEFSEEELGSVAILRLDPTERRGKARRPD